jgi:hypothetical protein
MARGWWPKETALQRWPADYADLLERVQRTGRLDVGELAAPHSGDSYQAFYRRRHGEHAFVFFTWEEVRAYEVEHEERQNPGRAARLQAIWEAEERARRQAKEDLAARRWQAEEAQRERERRIEEVRRRIEEVQRTQDAAGAEVLPFIAQARRFWFHFGFPSDDTVFVPIRVTKPFSFKVGRDTIDFPVNQWWVPLPVALELAAQNLALAA